MHQLSQAGTEKIDANSFGSWAQIERDLLYLK